MYRHLLRSAAVSALAVWASGCADTPAAKPSATLAGSAAKTTVAPAAPITTADAGVHDLATELHRAQTLRAQGQLTEATHVLAQLVLVAPDDAGVVGEYGKVLVQQGRSDDAAAFLKRATDLKPTDWTLFSALGVAYDQMDDRKNAKTAYERALALHPGDPTILNNYAVSRLLAGDYDAAQKLLLAAQAHGANNPKIASNLQWLAERKAGKAAHPATATAAVAQPGAKPPRVIATATAQAAPASSMNSVSPPATAPAKTNAAPAKITDTPRAMASATQWTPAKTTPKDTVQAASVAPKHSAQAVASSGRGAPRSIVQASANDAKTPTPQTVTDTARPEKAPVKAEKKVAEAAAKPTPARSATAAPPSAKAAAPKAKSAKVPPPALRTADQGG